MKIKNPLIVMAVALLLSAPLARCAWAIDQDLADRYPQAVLWPEGRSVSEAEYLAEVEKELELDIELSVLQGYDNNADLDSKRHKDGFLQSALSMDLARELDGPLTLRAGGDIFSRVYYSRNNNNLLNVLPYIGVDWHITPDVVSRTRVGMDYLLYPNEHDETYIGLFLGEYLRHYLTNDLYHEAGYEYVHRWYPTRRITLNDLEQGSSKRRDGRHRMKHRLRWMVGDFLLGLDNQLSFNRSNEEYRSYYDWLGYRLSPSVMYFITDDLYAFGSFIYRRTAYRDRRASNDENKKVRDNNFIFTGSVFYDMTSNVTLGVTYSYVENKSNDPAQEYSGSMLTGGLYYDF